MVTLFLVVNSRLSKTGRIHSHVTIYKLLYVTIVHAKHITVIVITFFQITF